MGDIFQMPIEGGEFSTQPGEKKGSAKTVWKDEKGNTHSVTYYTEKDLEKAGQIHPDLELVHHGENKLYIDQKLSSLSKKEQELFVGLFFSSMGDVQSLHTDTEALYKERGLSWIADEIKEVFEKRLLDLIMRSKLQEGGVSKVRQCGIHALTGEPRKFYTIECRRSEGDVTIVAKGFINGGGFKSAKKVVTIGANRSIGRANAARVLLKPKDRKSVTPEQMAAFRREVEVQRHLTRIGVPHIVRVHDVLEKRGQFHGFLVDSGSLGDCRFFSQSPPMTVAGRIASLRASLHLAEALEAMHKAGFCHNDVKPDNVMLSQALFGTIEAKLGDFGLTSKEGEALPTVCWRHATYSTIEAGAKKRAVATKENDVWALGVAIFEMIYGERSNPLRFLPFFPPSKEEYDMAVNAICSRLNPDEGVDKLLLSIFVGDVKTADTVAASLREALSSLEKTGGFSEEDSYMGDFPVSQESDSSIGGGQYESF